MAYRTLDRLDVKNKRVLLRVDLNVPVKDDRITDTTRIDRVIPTIRALLDRGAAVLVLSHFERPKGKVVPEMSLARVAPALEKALDLPVRFVETDWTDGRAEAAAAQAKPGDVLLFENTRFHPGEEKNNPDFARLLASLGDAYVNDAFSAAHRAHASTEGVAHHLDSAAGLSMQAELDALGSALEDPERPVLAIVGGAKVSTKLDLLGNLVKKVDRLVIGGGMANTFLAAQGVAVGRSLMEADRLDTARAIAIEAAAAGCEIILPVDAVVATRFEAEAENRTVRLDSQAIADDEMILDIGPDTVALVTEKLKTSRTVVWNGPVGAFETPPFDRGTLAIARFVADRTFAGWLRSIAGGGDTVAALNTARVTDDFTYVSTAGGAFLEWLEGKTLPGVAVL